MNAMRVTMAMIMAALVPLWCCCAAGRAAAAHAAAAPVVDSAPAGHSCCESKGEKPVAPAPDKPTENNEPCDCGAEKAQPPVVNQTPGLPGLELVQSLLAFAPPSPFAVDPGLNLNCAGHVPERCDGPPETHSLLAQHTLLLN